jgi:hypothetical protein
MAFKYIKWLLNISNGFKIYQMALKYIEWLYNISNGLKIDQHLTLQDFPKCTQIPTFGLKINHCNPDSYSYHCIIGKLKFVCEYHMTMVRTRFAFFPPNPGIKIQHPLRAPSQMILEMHSEGGSKIYNSIGSSQVFCRTCIYKFNHN